MILKVYGKGIFHEVLIDDEDYDKIKHFVWNAKLSGNGKFYIQHVSKGPRPIQKSKTFYLHRLIMGSPKGFDIDHINGNPLDNRKENLRICTRSQNTMNSGKPKTNTSGYKGVHLSKKHGSYAAAITVNKKIIYLGSFKTAEEAYEVYKAASVKYHGEFSRLD